MVRSISARQLDDLFYAFEQLERGEQIILTQPGTENAEAPLPHMEGACLGVYSSGTSGKPKLSWCSWGDLLAETKRSPVFRGWTWSSPFKAHTFAGVQVAIQAWSSGGRAVTLTSDWDVSWNLLEARHAETISCTPTYIDLLLQNEPGSGSKWKPRQITLGGEVLQPALGQRLVKRFPATRFTVVYATAELGVLLKTHRLDGWYELSHLSQRNRQWRMTNGQFELWRDGVWESTGDAVELRDELIRVAGRADAVANIAGTKVNLATINELAEQVPGVRRAIAVAVPNPITGQVICLKYALDNGADEENVKHQLEVFLQQRLPKEAWPRQWEPDTVGLRCNAKR